MNNLAGNQSSNWFSKNRVLLIVVAAITALIVIGIGIAYISGNGDGSGDPKEDVSSESSIEVAVEAVVDYYRESERELDSWWEVVALRGVGVDLFDDEWKLPDWSEITIEDAGPTTLAGLILGLMALGEDPATAWPEINLISELLLHQNDNGGFGGGINNTIWSIIALDSAYSEEFNSDMRERSIEYLINEQKEDGGFAYSGDYGDPDMTAMVLHALSGNMDAPGTITIAEKAISFLKESRLGNRGFSSFGQENSNSVAVVISGLLAVGEDPMGPDWTFSNRVEGDNNQNDNDILLNNEINLLDILLSYQLEDGSFTFLYEPPISDSMATAQALLALGDLATGKTIFSRFATNSRLETREDNEVDEGKENNKEDAPEDSNSTNGDEATDNNENVNNQPDSGERDSRETPESDATPSKPDSGKDKDEEKEEEKEEEKVTPPANDIPDRSGQMQVSVKVIGGSGVHFNSQVWTNKDGTSALDVLIATGLSYRTGYGGAYVSEVAGEKEDLTTGAGWKYKVNGVVPGVSSSTYIINANDTVIWWYADNPSCTGP